MKPKGFTLIEILLVIGLLALASSLCLPGFSRFAAQLHLDASAKALASELRQLQSRAQLLHCGQAFDPAAFSLPKNIKLTAARKISFAASGNPLPGGSGTLVLNNQFGQEKRVIVSSVGRVRLE